MDQAEAKRIVQALMAEFVAIQKQVDESLGRMRAIRKVVDGYREMFPDLMVTTGSKAVPAGPEPDLERPRGQEAVRRVLSDFPGRMWTVADVVTELDRRDWLPESDVPAAAVRTALERLVAADPDITKVKGERGTVLFTFSAAARGEVVA